MKKILIATTALVATAGVASAEITLSGSAAVGIAYSAATTQADLDTAAATAAGIVTLDANGEVTGGTAVDRYLANPTANNLAAVQAGAAATAVATQAAANGPQAASTSMLHRFILNASASVTTDGGVTMNVFSRVRTDQNERADGFNAPRFTISAGDFTVQAGNAAAAIASRTNYGGASTGQYYGNYGQYEMGFGVLYSSGSAPDLDRIRADYTMGDTVVSVSADTSGAERQEIGVSTSINGLNIGAGYASDKTWAFDANYSMNGVTVGGRATNTTNALYGAYNVGGFSFNAYTTDDSNMGFGAGIDLGGGATASVETSNAGSTLAYISFTF